MSAAKRPGIRDVARAAGVSISTVSRALRGYSDVNPATRQRILDLAESLGYTPDAAGQALKSGRTGTVAALVSGSHGPALLDDFYAEVLGGVEAHLGTHDLSLLLVRAGSSSAQRRILQGSRCDGVVALGCDLPAPFLLELQRSGVPLVLADAEPWHPSVPSVTVANEAGGLAATRHLLAGGRRRVAFVAEAPGNPNFLLRRRGYLRAHAEAGLAAQPELQQSGELGLLGGYLATQKLLAAAPFDAIFAANDTAAFGALRALAEAGLAVPGDVAVVGFDDIALARYSAPPLTTLHVPRRELGTAAAAKLLELLAGTVTSPVPAPLELPVTLTVRASSP